MIWQDYVLSFGSIILIFALIPSVISKNKPALATSIITGLVLTAFAITFATLQLFFTTITTASVAIMWFVLAVQKFKQQDKT